MALRPMLVAAMALALGQGLGVGLAEWAGAGRWHGAGLVGVTGAAAGVYLTRRRTRAGRSHGNRIGGWWVLLALGAANRSLWDDPRASAGPIQGAPGSLRVSSVEQASWATPVGEAFGPNLTATGGATAAWVGQVERVWGSRFTLRPALRPGWVHDAAGAVPERGEWVALLPPGEHQPFVEAAAAQGPSPTGGGIHRVHPDELVRLAAPARGPLLQGLQRLREQSDLLRGAITERTVSSGLAGERGLAPALLVGERSLLDPGVTDLFTRTGTRHLLALSGLHVGLLAAAVLFPCTRLIAYGVGRALGRPRASHVVRLCLRVFGVAGFALLAGGAPPVVRAALAVCAGVLASVAPAPRGAGGLIRHRRADALSIWGAALCLECLLDPRAVLELSVGLSYAATLGILTVAAPLTRRLQHGPGSERRRRQALRWTRSRIRVGASIVADQAGLLLRTSLACSLAAVLATLPFIWQHFGEVAWVGIPATLVGTPVLALLLIAEWVATLTLHPDLIAFAQWTEGVLVEIFVHFDRWPSSPRLLPHRPWPVVAGLSLWTSCALACGRWRQVAWCVLGLCGLASNLRSPVDGLRIDLLDVGHGTCAVIQAPNQPVVVFDAGARDRAGIVATGLKPMARRGGWDQLVVVSSHADFDHRSGLPWLVSRLPIALWMGEPADGLAVGLDRPRHQDVLCGPDRGAGRSSVTFGSGPDALHLTLLRGSGEGGNEGSRSLLVEWCSRRLLLCGDAVGSGLEASLRAGDLAGPFELVLLPHHGGFGPAVGRFLDQLDASRIWVSSATWPPLGAELDRRALPWQATGVDGPLWAELQGLDSASGESLRNPAGPGG